MQPIYLVYIYIFFLYLQYWFVSESEVFCQLINKSGSSGDPSNICWDISLWTINVNMLDVFEEKSVDHQSH